MLDFGKEKTPGIARLPTSSADGDLTPPDVKALGLAAVKPPPGPLADRIMRGAKPHPSLKEQDPAMGTQPPPDRIDPGTPPETPPETIPEIEPMPPEIEPPQPDIDQPGRGPDELPPGQV